MAILIRDLWPETLHKKWMDENFLPNVVTVIIPTFNRQEMIIHAVNSVFDQTYRPIELIIIDDGSTDETNSAIEKWLNDHQKDPLFTLHYLYHDNIGVSGARNLGLINSHGEFIQYLDSDDLLLPNRISVCVEAINTYPDVDFVHSAFYLDYSIDSKRGFILSKPANIQRDPNPRNYVWTAAGFFRRNLICNAGPWNESLSVCEDSEYFSRVLAITDNCLAIPDALIIKRKHSGSRLVDVRMGDRGLKDKYQSLILKEKLLQTYGDYQGTVNAKLWVVQDAFSAGLINFGIQVLRELKSESKKSSRTRIRWILLYYSTILSEKYVMLFWKKITFFRNEIKWKVDMIKGKLIKAQKNISKAS